MKTIFDRSGERKESLKYTYLAGAIIIFNFLARIFIFYRTELFNFSDYSVYLEAVNDIGKGHRHYLLEGNFLFAISYISHYLKEITGSQYAFYILNCFSGSITGLVLYRLIVEVSGSEKTGVVSLLLLTFYTEYMAFSSVFYTPVIMIFLLSLLIYFTWKYLKSENLVFATVYIILLAGVYLLTFFFKPELKYLPFFILLPAALLYRRYKIQSGKLLLMAIVFLVGSILLPVSGIISSPKENVISNSFVFFGHTDYGGKGGEGAFVYKENETRYDSAFSLYKREKKLDSVTLPDYNRFQAGEIKKYITGHPFRWAGLQAAKFFRTFGIVPESTSFSIIYTGLLKHRLWLSAAVVVMPVVIIILMLILFVDFSSLLRLARQNKGENHPFFVVYLTLFAYYIIATIFYGQYQERYRMPVFVVFLIPILSYSISTQPLIAVWKSRFRLIRVMVLVVIIAIWIGQARNTLNDSYRVNKMLERLK